MTHDDLKKAASDAIGALFSDSTVLRSKTADSLEELRDEIDMMLDSLEDKP